MPTNNLLYQRWHTSKRHPAIRTYTFDLTKANPIFDQLLTENLVKLPIDHAIPKAKEIKNKFYFKFHNLWKHATNNCVVYLDVLQDLIEKGKLKFPESDKANQLVDTDPFSINMVNVNFPKGHRRS